MWVWRFQLRTACRYPDPPSCLFSLHWHSSLFLMKPQLFYEANMSAYYKEQGKLNKPCESSSLFCMGGSLLATALKTILSLGLDCSVSVCLEASWPTGDYCAGKQWRSYSTNPAHLPSCGFLHFSFRHNFQERISACEKKSPGRSR